MKSEMSFPGVQRIFWLLLVIGAALSGALAQDASVDKLLSELPPPEKLAKPPVQRALQQPDPAVQDPLVKQIVQALPGRE